MFRFAVWNGMFTLRNICLHAKQLYRNFARPAPETQSLAQNSPSATQDTTPEKSVGRVARNRMRIAWMYYVEGLTQNEIADRLGIGRVTVVRNINEAIKQREVKIWITGNIAECLDLEARLKLRFGLVDAVVTPEPADAAHVGKAIGFAAGMYVTDQLTDGFHIGVGWGATLHDSLQTLSPKDLQNVEVVSMLGGVVQARRFNPSEFAWQFANIVGADCYLLTAPAVVDSPETKRALIERCGLSEVISRVNRLDMALVSVGTMAPQSLVRAGAVGDCLFNFYDAQGRLVDHPINDRVMSMPIEALRSVPRRVMISGGVDKVDALIGGLRLTSANVLITSEATAAAMLARG
jgi:DNA-binding transcriptional regulator LsrR (DeoR family)